MRLEDVQEYKIGEHKINDLKFSNFVLGLNLLSSDRNLLFEANDNLEGGKIGFDVNMVLRDKLIREICKKINKTLRANQIYEFSNEREPEDQLGIKLRDEISNSIREIEVSELRIEKEKGFWSSNYYLIVKLEKTPPGNVFGKEWEKMISKIFQMGYKVKKDWEREIINESFANFYENKIRVNIMKLNIKLKVVNGRTFDSFTNKNLI